MFVEMGTGCFHTDFPIDVETGKIAFLMDGTQFNVTFFNEEQAVYVFESEVSGKVKGRIPMIQLLLPEAETFVKIQWRQILLLDVTLDTAIHPEHSVYPFSHINGGYQRWRSFHKAFKRHCNSTVSQLYLWMPLTMKSGEFHYLRLKAKSFA
ncbi:flagellar brake domain-containing protein [Peribacillus frigoritolerans]|uniref:flagellar brake protein n=1 Tax=Peribacillus frigoritolerans TaxID=450367 RepID=UPI0039A0E557